MRYPMLLALALLLCSSCAFCQTNTSSVDINASSLRALLVDSSAKLESYSFSMEMAQNIDLVNLSSMEAQRLCTRSIGLGLANITDRSLKLVMASLTYAKGNEENSSAVALEEYLLNDTIYLKLDGNWTVLQIPAAAEAWSQQSTMEQQVNIFNQSNLTLIGAETVEGQDCYKVRAIIDTRNYASLLSGVVASYPPATPANNTTDLFSNITLDVYYWITKETHLLKKTGVHEVLNLAPQSLGLPAAGGEVWLDSTTTMIFGGFNESVNIVLPSDAVETQPFPPGLPPANEAVPIASNESEIRSGETMFNGAGLNESITNTTGLSETMPNIARSKESTPITAKLNESKSRLSESISRLSGSIPSTPKLNESKSRLNESVSRLSKSMPNAAVSSVTLPNAIVSNATASNATASNATMQVNRTIQAASTPWRIFL